MLTPAILGSLRIPTAAAPAVLDLVRALTGGTLTATLEANLPDGLLLRLADGKALQAQGNLPFPLGSLLTLKALPLPGGAGIHLQVTQATPPPSPALLAPLVLGEALQLLGRLQQEGGSNLAVLFRQLIQAGPSVAEAPETWSTWMKQAMTALADPAQSPMEAPFHQLQAKEGTALFELPLPWAPGAEPLRIWIESEQASAHTGDDAVHRAFLSVAFSEWGEVRLALEQRPSGLRVRLWLKDPERMASILPELQAELATQGRPVDLQVLSLPDPAPDLRALAGGTALQALG